MPQRTFAPEPYLEEDSEEDEFAELTSAAGPSWIPDDWSDNAGEQTEDEEYEQENGEELPESTLRNELKKLPLAAVLNAQGRILPNEAGPSKNKAQRLEEMRVQLADRTETDRRETPAIESRESKHAPTAISSKKQVSRSRQVIEVPKQVRRDPRFSAASAGSVDPLLHEQSYSFLPTMLQEEYDGLKTAVNMAVRAERNCPWAEKAQRTAEKEQLEKKLDQVRSRIDRTQRQTREREALSGVKREEREKRQRGKGEWHMKKADKRDLLLKAHFQQLEAEGPSAVKKAVERKRRKTAQKEKRSRPDVIRRRLD